jgi:hypothetical protein
MQGRTTMPPALHGRAQQAKSQQPSRCQPLEGRLHADLVRAGWRAIKKHAADGVDRGSAQEDAANLEDPLRHLVARLKSPSSRATRVRRHSRPQGGGT